MRWLSSFGRPLRSIKASFRRIRERVIDRWYDLTESFGSGFSIVTAPLRAARRIVTGFVGMLARLTQDFHRVMPLEFFARWAASRDYRSLLAAAPAMLAGTALTAGAALAVFSEKPSGADYFVNRALSAKRGGQDDVAELYLHKASLSVQGTTESQFNQAILLLSVDKEAEGVAILQRLAPDDAPGYVPAHEWRIQWMATKLRELAEKETPLTIEEKALRDRITSTIELHLRLILQAEPDHLRANHRLGMLAISRKRLGQAADHFAKVVDRNPDVRVNYAELLKKTGREQEAERQAELARLHHEQALQNENLSEQLKWQHRLKLSSAHALTGDHEESVKALMIDGKMPKIQQLRKPMAEALFRWSESITGEDAPSLIRRLEMLGQALKLQPANPDYLGRVAEIAGAPGEPGTIASETLRDLLSSGQAPPVVHFMLAMNAMKQRDMRTAMMHLEIAYSMSKDTPVILNNLAYVIVQQPNADYGRALDLISQAIELNPDIPDFYDTRGEILMKLGRWKPAIVDLETALRKLPGRAPIHRRLAVCYDAAGDPDLAALHRRRAEMADEAAAEAKRESNEQP